MARRKWTELERESALGLRRAGKSFAEIEKLTGIPTSTVSQWTKEADLTDDAAGDSAPSFVVPPPLSTADDAGGTPPPSYEHRAADSPPLRPRDARSEPVDIDYGELESYIAGFYKLSAQLASQNDDALAMAISTHADEAGVAWAEWVKSEPKVAAMLQRLMIGTPLGKVIGVHVSIGLAYFLARNAQRDIASAAAAAASGEPVPA